VLLRPSGTEPVLRVMVEGEPREAIESASEQHRRRREASGALKRPFHVVVALGLTQTLAWGTTYYLPAILANNMATELGIATPWIFTAFSAGLLLSAFLGPASGRLIDVHGGRRVLPASNLLIAAAWCCWVSRREWSRYSPRGW
jgi:hypothetical protein